MQQKVILKNNCVYYLIWTSRGYMFYDDIPITEKECISLYSADFIITRTGKTDREVNFLSVDGDNEKELKLIVHNNTAYVEYEKTRIPFSVSQTNRKYNHQKLLIIKPENHAILEILCKSKGFFFIGIAHR